MFSLNSSSSAMENIISNRAEFDGEFDEETISNSFICCVCLDLLYKPIVLDCGHVSCFWCVYKSMNSTHESHCPICRHSYNHFPAICQMLHFLLLKMYPLAYRRREKQVLEEEKRTDYFSPQLDSKEVKNVGVSKKSLDAHIPSNMPSAPCEGKDCFKEDSNCSAASAENNSLSMDFDETCRMPTNDVLCSACKQFLFRPAVLNCGHVYCEACIIVPDDEIIICEVCESPHPTDFPNVCLEFNNFLEEKFPKEYASRRQNVEQKQAQCQHKDPPVCSSLKKSAKKGFRKSSETSEDSVQWWRKLGSSAHYGVGCDDCGICPIIGDRYKCLDCEELIGFDLCGDCYNTCSKRPGRFNQQHTPDHRLERVKKPGAIDNLMTRQPVGGRHVDSFGAPVQSVDGWIAIESAVANVLAIESAVNTGGSTSMEFRDAPDDNIDGNR